MRKYFTISILYFSVIAISANAQGIVPVFLNSFIHPGDAVVVNLPASAPNIVSATFNGSAIPFFPYKTSERIVFGVPAKTALGNYVFKINFASGETYSKTIHVIKKYFPVLVFNTPPESGLTNDTVTGALVASNDDLNKLFSASATVPLFQTGFALPLRDNSRIGSVYGEIRQTGANQIRHLGVDFIAPMGAAVASINNGVVKKAYYDSTYGNTIVVDHGGGIYSLYLHLSKFFVKAGHTVKKGTLIGAVGKTGLASGPHLHLSIKIGDVSVDPLQF